MLSHRIIRILTWLFALTLAAWLIRDLPFNTIFKTIISLTTAQWFYWLVVNLAIILILVWRWWVLAEGLELKLNFSDLLLLRQAGQSISFITPGPQFGGEPLQIFYLWKKYSIPAKSSVLIVAADRFFELWANFSVLLFGIIILIFTESSLADWFSIALIIILLILLLSLSTGLLIYRGESIKKSINRFAQKWLSNSRLAQIAIDSNKNSESNANSANAKSPVSLNNFVTKKSLLFFALVLSLGSWLLTFFELYLVLSFFNLKLNISQFVLLLVAMRLAFLLPLPGGIGTLEASVIWSFTALALPINSAAALLALIRFRDILVLGAGFICLRLLQPKTVTV